MLKLVESEKHQSASRSFGAGFVTGPVGASNFLKGIIAHDRRLERDAKRPQRLLRLCQLALRVYLPDQDSIAFPRFRDWL